MVYCTILTKLKLKKVSKAHTIIDRHAPFFDTPPSPRAFLTTKKPFHTRYYLLGACLKGSIRVFSILFFSILFYFEKPPVLFYFRQKSSKNRTRVRTRVLSYFSISLDFSISIFPTLRSTLASFWSSRGYHASEHQVQA